MKENRTWSTFVQVRSNQLVTYDRPNDGFSCPTWRKPPTRKGYTGEVTASTKKRIETAVDIFLQMAPERRIYNPVTKRNQNFKLSFITLTVSAHEPVSTPDAHAALKVWLQHFRRPWHKRRMSEQMSTYLWKAELQKRGQIHYHLTTNAWLHLIEIRRVWNDIQKARGWTADFYKAKGHHDPNSTDVHSIYRIKDVRRYLSKYIAKQQFEPSPANPEAGFPSLMQPVTMGGKVWGCSEDLKGKKRFSEKMDAETWDNMCEAYGNGALRKYESEHCIFYDSNQPENLLSFNHFNQYQLWQK